MKFILFALIFTALTSKLAMASADCGEFVLVDEPAYMQLKTTESYTAHYKKDGHTVTLSYSFYDINTDITVYEAKLSEESSLMLEVHENDHSLVVYTANDTKNSPEITCRNR